MIIPPNSSPQIKLPQFGCENKRDTTQVTNTPGYGRVWQQKKIRKKSRNGGTGDVWVWVCAMWRKDTDPFSQIRLCLDQAMWTEKQVRYLWNESVPRVEKKKKKNSPPLSALPDVVLAILSLFDALPARTGQISSRLLLTVGHGM